MQFAKKAMSSRDGNILLGYRGGYTFMTCRYSLAELADGLAALAANDAIKESLIQSGICKVIGFLLGSENVELQAHGVDIVWTMSFDAKSRTAIVGSEEKLIDKLRSLQSFSSSYEVRKDATKALTFIETWNNKVIEAEKASHGGDKTNNGHIFLSYCWRQQQIVLKIKEGLVQQGFKVWVGLLQIPLILVFQFKMDV